MTKEKEVAEMKNDFVSNVSHELRTPLASIKAYVEMLIDGEADDEKTKREFYEVIQNEANRLGRLIDNILNISRIESGLVKINKQPQSLTVIMKEAIEVITPQARTKNKSSSGVLAELDDRAVRENCGLLQHVIDSLAVQNGSSAAGVVGHHAADGGAARGGDIRREAHAVRLQLCIQFVEDDAGCTRTQRSAAFTSRTWL